MYLILSLFFSILLTVNAKNRKDILFIQLTKIGDFGLQRKERVNVPAHLHTGIDIRRPDNNYHDEPVFSLAEGHVISIRRDGPYAQIIIEHTIKNHKFWTLYEHISGILIKVNDQVSPKSPIARFMNKSELDKYGWQFDHFHLEILKVKPKVLKPDLRHPERFFCSYSLNCFNAYDL
jgi:hypothetical protein